MYHMARHRCHRPPVPHDTDVLVVDEDHDNRVFQSYSSMLGTSMGPNYAQSLGSCTAQHRAGQRLMSDQAQARRVVYDIDVFVMDEVHDI